MSSASAERLVRPWQATAAMGALDDEARRENRRVEDARLAVRARNGDDEAFRTLVEKYQRKVYWIAYDVLLDGEEARDVAQETFIRVHGALASFDAKRDFLNWLYRIARNLAIDTFRRRRRRALPMEDLTALSEAPQEPAVETRGDELRERVALVLADLPVDYRLTLTLREFHGMTPREIAELTDCTYPTARWRLHRARALFRRAWEKRFGHPPTEESS